MTFGERLSRYLEFRYMSQSEFARRCGLEPSHINHFCTDRRLPSLPVFARMLRQMSDVNVGWLLEGLEP